MCSNWNKLLLHAKTWKNLGSLLLSGKNTITKHYMLYDCIYMTFEKKQLLQQKAEQWLPDARAGSGLTVGEVHI